MRAYWGTAGLLGALVSLVVGCSSNLPGNVAATGGVGAGGVGTGGLGVGGLAAAGAGGAAITSTGGATGRSNVPTYHRATATACSTALPDASVPSSVPNGGSSGNYQAPYGPTAPDGGVITCSTDGDCPPCQNGQLDHCFLNRGTFTQACVCDQCNTDQDCGPSGACVCNASGWSGTSLGNRCVYGNCRVDSDCGPAGFCSPTPDIRGLCGVTPGYYCHTAADQCVNGGDCAPDASAMPTAAQYLCTYSSAVAAWTCSGMVCGGG